MSRNVRCARLFITSARDCHARQAGKVIMTANIDPAVALQQSGDSGLLLCAVFDEQHAIVLEDGTAVGCENADCIEAILACSQRRLRFVLQLQQGIVVAAHIRWVGHDNVEAPAADRRGPAPKLKLDIAQRQRTYVFTRYGNGALADICGSYLAHSALTRDGNRNRAAPCTEIENLPFRLAGYLAQGKVDEQLSLRARHQGCRADQQLVRPEFAAAHDVSHGFATIAACQQCLKALHGELVEFIFRVREQVAARHIDSPAQQYLSVEPR